MTARRDAIIKTIKSIQDKTGKHYCFPPYKRIQEILLKFYGLKANRRTLYRDMKWLVEGGFIHKQHRSPNKKAIDFKFKSNLYWLKREGYRYLESLWYWAKNHVHGYRVTKKSLDKLPHSRVSSFVGRSEADLWYKFLEKGGASPSEAIL